MTTSALARARSPLFDLESFSRRCRLHPELVRRLVSLGLLEPIEDERGTLWFGTDQIAAVARLQRLRAGLSVNYAALGLVAQLLDRINELERALRQRPPTPGGRL
ncbi:MAG TPA: chaperone modulator CbpM [Acidimicrobiales bacterium]|nr:chaperone modulator CbpM [Acidimicrobiales bacterium]